MKRARRLAIKVTVTSPVIILPGQNRKNHNEPVDCVVIRPSDIVVSNTGQFIAAQNQYNKEMADKSWDKIDVQEHHPDNLNQFAVAMSQNIIESDQSFLSLQQMYWYCNFTV